MKPIKETMQEQMLKKEKYKNIEGIDIINEMDEEQMTQDLKGKQQISKEEVVDQYKNFQKRVCFRTLSNIIPLSVLPEQKIIQAVTSLEVESDAESNDDVSLKSSTNSVLDDTN